jgi:molybdenum cofactor biosynthesis protein A
MKKLLTDTFGRKHTYLRISLTEKCNLRCLYCMPEEGISLTPSKELLTLDEIKRLSTLFVERCGIKKIRLTGGEPTIRKDLTEIMEYLGNLKNQKGTSLSNIGMTSNGLVLKKHLSKLNEAGLDGLNISLDTLCPYKFQLITRRKGLERVKECIEEALKYENINVKINCVVMRDVNLEEILDFIEFVRDKNVTLRFIEYMPFEGNKWNDKRMVSYREMLNIIQNKFGPLIKIPDDRNDTTKAFRINGIENTKIGFITSMTENFCSSCNRLRITADGNLKVCLFGNTEISLRDIMRSGASDDDIIKTIDDSVKRKKFSHSGTLNLAKETMRPMILIGG